MEAANLIAKCRDLGVTLGPSQAGRLRATPPGALPEELRAQLRRHETEVVAALKQQEDGFLQRHVSASTLEAIPDWKGLFVKSSVLHMTVWLVRCRPDGEALAHETWHPALLLDEVLTQRGHTQDEARAELLHLLITAATIQ